MLKSNKMLWLKKYMEMPGAREFILFYGLLFIGILHIYFPPSAISVTSNDQIDSFLAYFGVFPKVWESLFSFNYELPRHMSGVTLNSIASSEFNMGRIIASIFPAYWEFSVFYLVYLSALFGSSLLLYRQITLQFLSEDKLTRSDFSLMGFAALFTVMLPHNSVVIGTLIGLNFFALATLKALNGAKGSHLVILFLLSGLFGNFVLGAYFYIPACIVLATVFSWKSEGKARMFKWLGIGTLIVILCEYRMFAYIAFPGEVSHRANWLGDRTYSWSSLFSLQEWKEAIKLGIDVVKGKTPHNHYQWNTGFVAVKLISFAAGVYFVIKACEAFVNRRIRPTWDNNEKSIFLLFMATVASILIVLLGYGVLKSGVLNLALITGQPFQFERVIVSLPMLAGLALLSGFMLLKTKVTLSLEHISTKVLAVLSAILIAYTMHDALIRKSANIKHHNVAGKDNPFIPKYTLGSKYNKGGYDAVKAYLGEGWRDERVISVIVDPMGTAYNGFATLDGYFPNYPERYQQEFLTIISPAFEDIGPNKSSYYTGWGNRLRVPVIKNTADKKVVVKIDGCAFEGLGGTLVLSASEIAQPAISNLEFDGTVKGVNKGLKSTFWLYRPISKNCVA